MCLKYLLVVLIGIALPVTGYAEFYRYTDDKGIIRYTDDLTKVPESQRPQVKQYKEADDSLTPEQRAEKALRESRESASDSGKETGIGTSGGERTDMTELERLNRKKAALDKEYADLVKEKEDLVKAKPETKKDADLKAYNERVVDLNDRISRFEIQRQEFSKEVDAFNERFRK